MTTLSYLLTFQGNIHIGSGAGIPGVLDERVLRDQDNFAYLPSSTVKGLVRQSCIDLLYYHGQQERLICVGQQRWSREDNEQPKVEEYCQVENCSCLICSLFGSPVIESALWFSPAEYPLEYRELVGNTPFPFIAAERDMATSAHAAIDRHSGRAKEHQLFNLEVVQPGDQFTGEVRIIRPLQAVSLLPNEPALSTKEVLGWLTAALLFTRAVGGRRRRGWGQCRFILPETKNAVALQALRQLLGTVK